MRVCSRRGASLKTGSYVSAAFYFYVWRFLADDAARSHPSPPLRFVVKRMQHRGPFANFFATYSRSSADNCPSQRKKSVNPHCSSATGKASSVQRNSPRTTVLEVGSCGRWSFMIRTALFRREDFHFRRRRAVMSIRLAFLNSFFCASPSFTAGGWRRLPDAFPASPP